ncbi:MAG: peptide chain release factor 1 [Epulopiscium sp. Nele67-Bin004]|nr:MAG: peptide chain release factor 1 [Epulopiscium sp. Nele67-Bin004]
MFDQLEELIHKFENISEKVNDPAVIADQETWRKLMKELSELEPIVEKYKEYKATLEAIDDALVMLEDNLDEDFKALVKEELADNKKRVEPLENELKILLIPKDPNDDKNVIVEIRGGAGGDEAALFAADLYRMYNRFCERSKWKSELMEVNESGIGGFKEVIFMLRGEGAYSRLKYESGVHRVQRIPSTESGGRIHTSTVTVAVLPEAEDVDVELNMSDVKVDVFRSSGNGGQSVNTTDSAVRLTHGPSGIVVSCQDEKSQLKNKEKALKVLRAKLYEAELQKQHDEMAAEKRSQVGTGDRSERIRTYNFPQGRVTDHRVGLTLHKLDQILDGDLEEIISTLTTVDQAEKLRLSTAGE